MSTPPDLPPLAHSCIAVNEHTTGLTSTHSFVHCSELTHRQTHLIDLFAHCSEWTYHPTHHRSLIRALQWMSTPSDSPYWFIRALQWMCVPPDSLLPTRSLIAANGHTTRLIATHSFAQHSEWTYHQVHHWSFTRCSEWTYCQAHLLPTHSLMVVNGHTARLATFRHSLIAVGPALW